MGVGDLDDLLHLLDAVRGHGARGDPFFRLSEQGRVRVAIEIQIFVAGEDPLLADRRLELGDGGGEIALRDARRYSHWRDLSYARGVGAITQEIRGSAS